METHTEDTESGQISSRIVNSFIAINLGLVLLAGAGLIYRLSCNELRHYQAKQEKPDVTRYIPIDRFMEQRGR